MAHITHTKPSTFTTLCNWFTLEGNPTRVNCWFCNCDAYLLAGSKQTPTNWYCDLCDNINTRDEYGNIIDPSLQYSYKQPDKSHCFHLQPRQSLRSLCNTCIENEEMILRLVTEYIPDEDDPTFKHRFNTSDDYVESLHAKHPICKECQKKMDSLIEEQKEAERSRNFISRITYSLTTKPPKRPSRLSYLLQGLLYIWTHTVAIATLLYGYYYISNLLFIPPSWVQLDTIYSALDGLVELAQTPWSIDRIYQLLIIQTGQHVVYFFYNTYLLVYKVAMESKTRLDDWELEDFAFGFYIANIMSWVIIDWHPVTINTFVEEPGRVRNWHAYKMIQRLLYIARIGNLVLINHAADNAWILTALGCYLTLWLVSILMVRAPSRKRVTRTPIIKPLSGVLKQMLYGIYQTCRDNVIWIKKRLTFKWPVKKVIQEQQQQDHQSMDIDDDAIYQDQNRSEEEVERVATKMGYIRL